MYVNMSLLYKYVRQFLVMNLIYAPILHLVITYKQILQIEYSLCIERGQGINILNFRKAS